MSVVTYETVTSFYYEISTIIDRVHLGILYKVRKRDDILRLGENSGIDAELLIKEYLQSIAYDVFSKLISPLGRDLDDLDTPLEPFEYNETFTHPETEATTDNCIIYRVIFPEKFDDTTKPPIYKALEDTLVSYCIWQWLMDSNIPDWPKYEAEHERKYKDLRSLIVRRVNLKRSYKLY
jgi:hypothetical protein